MFASNISETERNFVLRVWADFFFLIERGIYGDTRARLLFNECVFACMYFTEHNRIRAISKRFYRPQGLSAHCTTMNKGHTQRAPLTVSPWSAPLQNPHFKP